MEFETRGTDPPPRPMDFEDHVSDDVQDSPRTNPDAEITAFSEAIDLLVERDSTASACINAGVDFQAREGVGEDLRTAHASCENNHDQSLDGCVDHHQGGNDCLSQYHDRHSSEDINECIQPSSMTNLCDAPAQCGVVGPSDVTTLQTTNLGQYPCTLCSPCSLHTYKLGYFICLVCICTYHGSST